MLTHVKNTCQWKSTLIQVLRLGLTFSYIASILFTHIKITRKRKSTFIQFGVKEELHEGALKPEVTYIAKLPPSNACSLRRE